MEQAFKKAKVALFETAILAHPQSEPEQSLAVDASNHHMGGGVTAAEVCSWLAAYVWLSSQGS